MNFYLKMRPRITFLFGFFKLVHTLKSCSICHSVFQHWVTCGSSHKGAVNVQMQPVIARTPISESQLIWDAFRSPPSAPFLPWSIFIRRNETKLLFVDRNLVLPSPTFLYICLREKKANLLLWIKKSRIRGLNLNLNKQKKEEWKGLKHIWVERQTFIF